MHRKSSNILRDNANIEEDMAFIDGILAAKGFTAEPEVTPLLLSLAYTMMKDKLLAAKLTVDMQNKSVIELEDVILSQLGTAEVAAKTPADQAAIAFANLSVEEKNDPPTEI